MQSINLTSILTIRLERVAETAPLSRAMARASRGPSPQVSGRPDVSRESSASHQTGRDGLAPCGGSRSPGVLNECGLKRHDQREDKEKVGSIVDMSRFAKFCNCLFLNLAFALL